MSLSPIMNAIYHRQMDVVKELLASGYEFMTSARKNPKKRR